MKEVEKVIAFLGCRTPEAWLLAAQNNIPLLLVDHAHCEHKAALSAMSLIKRYPEDERFVQQLSRFVREEMRHFEMVLSLMAQRNIRLESIKPSRYAASLHQLRQPQEPELRVDLLLIAAFIEARSCERFYSLINCLDDELKVFYSKLLASEARHFEQYIDFARQHCSPKGLNARVEEIRAHEASLICSNESVFRFHSGAPVE